MKTKMNAFSPLGVKLLASIVIVAAAGASVPAVAGPKCGGFGGDKTYTFTCRSGQYMNGVSAKGKTYVEELRFTCTDGARSRKIGGGLGLPSFGNPTVGSASCGSDLAISYIPANCGAYVDRIEGIHCAVIKSDGTLFDQTASVKSLNVGGGGGGRGQLECPRGKGVYKVRVKYGSWIDRIEIFCR